MSWGVTGAVEGEHQHSLCVPVYPPEPHQLRAGAAAGHQSLSPVECEPGEGVALSRARSLIQPQLGGGVIPQNSREGGPSIGQGIPNYRVRSRREGAAFPIVKERLVCSCPGWPLRTSHCGGPNLCAHRAHFPLYPNCRVDIWTQGEGVPCLCVSLSMK